MTPQNPSEDPRKHKPEPTLSKGAKFAAIVAVALLFGTSLDSIMALFGVSFDAARASAWVLIPAIALSFFFVLSFHEAGHILGGKLVGFRFLLFVVGPVKLYAAEGGVRFGINRSLAMAGGLGGAAPTDSRNLRRRMMLYVAGGPVASLVLAALSFGVALVASPSVGLVFGITSLTSLFVGVVTLVPSKFGGFVSDGSRLLMLLRGGPEAERWAALSALGGASMAGVRPRDFDGELVERSLSPSDGSLDEAGARSTAHYRALDLGDPEKGEDILRPALDIQDVPEMLRSQLLLEAAFLRARFLGDPEEARKLFSTAKTNKVLDRSLPLRVEAAISLAEGDSEEARKKAKQSLDELGDSLSAGTAKLEREWLEEILAGRGETPETDYETKR